MAVVQKYKKYVVEKKQISHDRGKTWEDVTPSETRYGEELGIFDTLEECEDTNCDLEMYGTVYVDEPIRVGYCTRQTEGWGQMTLYTTLFPSGLAKSIHFTDGMYCCVDSWGSSTNIIKDEYHDAQWTTPTATITGPLQPVRRYNTFELNGREMISGEFCNHDTCFTIDEWMPWIDPNGTLKMAYKVHYVRNHCSEDWVIDEEFEPQFITIAERWRKTYEDAYKSVWQHQVASDIIYEGFSPMDGLPFQVVWQDEGESVEYFYETNIPENVEFIDAIINDGVICNMSVSAILPRVQMKIKVDSNRGDPTGNLMTKYYHYSTDTSGCTYPFYNYDYEGERRYYIDPTYDYGTRIYDDRYTTVNFDKWEQGSLSASYGALFCSIYIRQERCGRDYKGRVITCPVVYNGGSIANNTRCKEIIVFDTDEIYFPYKVRSNNGWQDDYLNACEYGFIKRDGSKIIVGYVYGKYTNTNGVTQNITNNANTSLSLPSDAVDVILADSVTSIPKNCFLNHTNLTSITMNNVTSIGVDAFQGTTNLQSMTFNSNVVIGANAFSNGGLRSVDLNNVSSLGDKVFSGCLSLVSVTIGSSLTSIPDYTFSGNTSLTSLTIPDNVTSIGSYIVYGCTNFDTLDLGKGITYLPCYFISQTVSLNNLILRYDEGVVDVAMCCGQYCGCSAYHNNFFGSNYENLKIYVPDDLVNAYKSSWNNLLDTRCNSRDYSSQIYPLSEYEYKFKAIYNDETVYRVLCEDADSTVITTADTRPSGYQLQNMTSAYIGRACVSSIGDNALSGCTSLSSVTFNSEIESIGDNAFRYCSGLTSIDLPNGITSIGNYAFQYCSGLTSVTMPDTVSTIGESLFASCYNLQSVTIPSGITSIPTSTFDYCRSLTSVTIPESVTSIGQYAFWDNRSLNSITIPKNVTFIGSGAFSNCSGLTSIIIEAVTPPTLAGSSVFNNTNNCPIFVPEESGNAYLTAEGWRVLADRIKVLKYKGTYNNGNINAVYYNGSSDLTSGETQPNGYDASGLTKAEIKDCVTNIDNEAFRDCSGLTSVTIPNTITEIGSYCFGWCVSLTSVTIPASITSISPFAFSNCTSLVSVTILATTPPAIYGDVFKDTTCKFYVPSGSVSAYKSANYWTNYSSRIYAIQ